MPNASEPRYTAMDIMRMLPHRFPFLLIDRVEELVQKSDKTRLGWTIRATKCVTINEPFFTGHFPHRPVMPGVLQIEAMAQAAALIVTVPGGPKLDVAIAGVNEARFRKPVVPGDVLDIHAKIIKDRGSMFVVECKAFVAGHLVAEAELLAKVFPLVDTIN